MVAEKLLAKAHYLRNTTGSRELQIASRESPTMYKPHVTASAKTMTDCPTPNWAGPVWPGADIFFSPPEHVLLPCWQKQPSHKQLHFQGAIMPTVVSLTPSPQRPGLLKQRDGRGRTDGFANAVSREAGCHNQGAKSWERKQQQPNLDFFTPSTENCAGCVLLSIKELI